MYSALKGTFSSFLSDKLVFEAQLLLQPKLRMDLYFREKNLPIGSGFSHRKKLKEELETLRQEIFNDPDNIVFQQNIYGLFK